MPGEKANSATAGDNAMTSGHPHRRCRSVPHRYVLAFALCLGFLLVIGIRSSFALVMTHVTAVNQSSATNLIFPHCPVSNTSADVRVDMRGDVMLMSHTAFYVGAAVAVFPSGIATTLTSPKLVAGVSVLLISLITLLFPFAIVYSTPLVFIFRVLEGVFDAGFQAAGNALISTWSTETDKGRLFPFITIGYGFAPAVASVLTATTVCFLRWDAVFYILGGASLLWTFVLFQCFYDTPKLHPRLTSEERNHHGQYGGKVRQSSIEVFKRAPWRGILTSRGVWVVVVAISMKVSVFAILTLEQAQYFQDSFGVKVEDLGMLLLLPYVLFVVATVLGGLASDKMIGLGLSTTLTRKIVFFSGYGPDGVCMLMLFFIHDLFPAYITLSIATAMEGIGIIGVGPLMSDISPQYTGLVFGVSAALAVGVVGVFITTFISITSGKLKTVESWQRTFLLCGVVHGVGCVLFGLLADASLQPWAEGSLPRPADKQDDHLTDHDHQDDGDDDDDDDVYEMVDSSTTALLSAHRTSRKS